MRIITVKNCLYLPILTKFYFIIYRLQSRFHTMRATQSMKLTSSQSFSRSALVRPAPHNYLPYEIIDIYLSIFFHPPRYQRQQGDPLSWKRCHFLGFRRKWKNSKEQKCQLYHHQPASKQVTNVERQNINIQNINTSTISAPIIIVTHCRNALSKCFIKRRSYSSLGVLQVYLTCLSDNQLKISPLLHVQTSLNDSGLITYQPITWLRFNGGLSKWSDTIYTKCCVSVKFISAWDTNGPFSIRPELFSDYKCSLSFFFYRQSTATRWFSVATMAFISACFREFSFCSYDALLCPRSL